MNLYVPDTRKKRRKKIFFLLAVAYVAILFISGIFGDMGLIANLKLHRKNQQILSDIRALEEENKKLRREADNLLGNPRYIEKIARQELNLSRENEIVFIFPKDKHAETAQSNEGDRPK